jgi:hypothetical protein
MTLFCVERSHSIYFLVQEGKQNVAATPDIWLKSGNIGENNFISHVLLPH